MIKLWSLWLLVLFLILWRHLFGRGHCKLWSSVLGSLVDRCKASSADSGNPSRRWRQGVERWLEPRNKHLVFAIALCQFCFKFLFSLLLSITCLSFKISLLVLLFLILVIYLVCTSSLHFIHSLFDQFSYNKVALRTSNPFKGNQEEGVRTSHGVFGS